MKTARGIFSASALVMVAGIALPTTVFAWGPLNHMATMKKVDRIIASECSNFPYQIPRPHLLKDIDPDLNGPSHGYDMTTGSDSISPMINKEYEIIVEKWSKGEDARLNVHRMVHYIADTMTIGQISGPALWGTKDNWIDLASELVSLKRIKRLPAARFDDVASANVALIDKMNETFDLYFDKTEDWFKCRTTVWGGEVCSKPTPFKVAEYTRRGIAEGASMAAGWLMLAAAEANPEVGYTCNK